MSTITAEPPALLTEGFDPPPFKGDGCSVPVCHGVPEDPDHQQGRRLKGIVRPLKNSEPSAKLELLQTTLGRNDFILGRVPGSAEGYVPAIL
jgi:hypothetical protein